jgi:hypothetical protein
MRNTARAYGWYAMPLRDWVKAGWYKSAVDFELPRPKGHIDDPTVPTPEEMRALKEFAMNKGPLWKTSLTHLWNTGADVNALHSGTGYLLRRLRNRLGPKWLTNFDDTELTRHMSKTREEVLSERGKVRALGTLAKIVNRDGWTFNDFVYASRPENYSVVQAWITSPHKVAITIIWSLENNAFMAATAGSTTPFNPEDYE